MYSKNPGQPICYKVEIIGYKVEFGVSSTSSPTSTSHSIIRTNTSVASKANSNSNFCSTNEGLSVSSSSYSKPLDVLATFYFKAKEEAIAEVSPLKWISCTHILFIPIYEGIINPLPEIRVKDALCLKMIVASDKNSHTFEEVKITPDTFFYRRVCTPVTDWYYATFIW